MTQWIKVAWGKNTPVAKSDSDIKLVCTLGKQANLSAPPLCWCKPMNILSTLIVMMNKENHVGEIYLA